MKLKFVDKSNTSRLNPYNGTYEGSNGGTELMFRHLMSRLSEEDKAEFQFICSRVRDLDPNKKRILMLHDHVSDPETARLADPEFRKNFSKLVFVSKHQFEQYRLVHGVTYDESVVIRNAINPIPAHEKPKGKINIIYHTTPHRGLELLVPAFNELCKYHDDIHLNVYSSFNIYGWSARDEPYRELFDFCRTHPNITYHGAVSNDDIRAALTNNHIFAYPSIWPETSCIAAIEAMAAGLLVVCSDFEALPETLHGFGICYRYSEDRNKHYQRFANVLHNAIIRYRNGEFAKRLEGQVAFANVNYSWDNRIKEWQQLLGDLKNNG